MKAVILVAGAGTRMWPLSVARPKHMLEVGGKPLISYMLQALADASITDVFLVVGFGSQLVQTSLGDGAQYGIHIEYLRQARLTGTASALRTSREVVGSEPFLTMYGDLWINSRAIQAVIEKARQSSRAMGVVLVANPSRYGYVELEGDRLAKIVEKPSRIRRKEAWVNSGIYVLDQEVFRAIEKTQTSRRHEYELTSSLNQLLREGKEIRTVAISANDWLDVGRPWDLLEANERVLATLTHEVKGTLEQGVVSKGPVIIEEGALIRSGCYLEGPIYVGKESHIGPNARIRPSTTIADGVVIGTSCEIKNSVIMRGTKIPHLSYVGDSIIGENCNLGAGTITANIRFDQEALRMRIKGHLYSTGRRKLGVIMGDGVQTGINASLMPGVRVGPNAWIGPGSVISRDVPSGKRVFASKD